MTITAKVLPPTPLPPIPDLYALRYFGQGRWTIGYGGSPREYIERQAALHTCSSLVIVPADTTHATDPLPWKVRFRDDGVVVAAFAYAEHATRFVESGPWHHSQVEAFRDTPEAP